MRPGKRRALLGPGQLRTVSAKRLIDEGVRV